ncbi:hypothetical protein [Prochlorococcus marinus]|uniref:Uncharacterized protein n=1 Tax=Prochlorococcus marinus XMU1408 TaxID=2213228 RepID=A0A318R0T3_PROMR|nr:hypothetical protein [Prochlorococcus marinus]MBW3041994.1 hypothetical protein [Prochlorococcus marinus str. XMU1408]PYE03117.1 hypothetical protein DNJ73_05100 [Prochlorococcus marinus XMU1408]
MKIINLLKIIPFLLTFLALFYLNINSNRENTKLKILIWNTPSLSLGKYLAFSTGTGFLLSYLVTTKFIRSNQYKLNREIKYKPDFSNKKTAVKKEIDNTFTYDNTLIERDIRDPSPTINANFRVISRNNKMDDSSYNIREQEFDTSGFIDDSDDMYFKKETNNDFEYLNEPALNDWDDDTYSKW